MKPILEEAIRVLRLVSLDCQASLDGGPFRRDGMLRAMRVRADEMISKYEAEKRREETKALRERQLADRTARDISTAFGRRRR